MTNKAAALPGEAPAAEAAPAVDSVKLDRYVELSKKLKKMKADAEDIGAEMGGLEEALLEQFAQTGTQSIKTSGGATIYIHKQLWASAQDGDSERLIKSLRKAGEDWSFMVKETVNTQTLSARIRECEADVIGNPILPAPLVDTVKVTLRTQLRVRKS